MKKRKVKDYHDLDIEIKVPLPASLKKVAKELKKIAKENPTYKIEGLFLTEGILEVKLGTYIERDETEAEYRQRVEREKRDKGRKAVTITYTNTLNGKTVTVPMDGDEVFPWLKII